MAICLGLLKWNSMSFKVHLHSFIVVSGVIAMISENMGEKGWWW